MKKVFLLLLAASLLVGPVSCKKDDPAPTSAFPTVPEAKSEHDNKSGGIYKGTFATATTTGTIKVVLQDGKTEIVVSYNGTTKTLTTTGLSGWVSGQAISNVLFTNGDWEVVFTVSANASSVDFLMQLAGESNFISVLNKEYSSALVKVYEGTFAGDDTGKWNFTLQGSDIIGVYASAGGSATFIGSVAGSTIAITALDVTATGTFVEEGASCSGTWDGGSTAGTWTGKRSL
jgi:hypothetical protein